MTLRTLAELRLLRRRADPLADDAVGALIAEPQEGERNLDKVRAGARKKISALVRFLDETAGVFDAREHDAGRRAIARHAPVSFLVLLAGSLVESFAVKEGARVLAGTGRLLRDPVNRIYETASLVRDLLVDDDFRVGGRAREALLNVRLLHAFVRRFTLSARAKDGAPAFDVDALGVPVNQMDMVHTLLMFSRVLADGTAKLGGALTDEERASWCALWRHSGALLGVDDDVLFRDVDDERALHQLMRSAYNPDDTSRALTFAVLDALSREPPFYLPKPGLYALSRTLVGDALADALHLPRSRAWRALPASLALTWRAVDVIERAVPFQLGTLAGTNAGHAFIEANRRRVLRTMPTASYSFRTAP